MSLAPLPLFTVLARLPAEELADIREPVRIMDWLMLSLVLAFLLIGAGTLYWLIQRRRRLAAMRPSGPPPIPPMEWAMDALDVIYRDQKSYSDKEYTAAVSGVLREYLERAFQLPAPEQTTEEFLSTVGQHPIFTPDMRRDMVRFLEQCDLVKFAAQQLQKEERPLLIEQARTFVKTAELNQTAPQTVPAS